MDRFLVASESRPLPLSRRLKKLEGAFLRPYRRHVAIAVAAMLVQSLLLVPLPWLQGWVIDRLMNIGGGGTGDAPLQWLLVAAAVIPLVCLLGRMALGWFSGGLMNRVSLEFVRALTDSLHRKLQRLPLAYFDRQETGQLMARLTNDVGTLLIFLSASSLQLIADLVLALGIIGGLIGLSWPLALVSFLALPLFFWNHRRFAARIWDLSRGVQQQTAGLYAVLSERISAVRTIRAFGTEQRELAEFALQLDRQTDESRKSLAATSVQSFMALLIGGLATVVLIGLSAALVQRGLITIGQAVAFITYLALFYQPLVRLTQFYGGITATLAAVDRITEVLAEPEPALPRSPRLPRRTRGELRLRNVSFRYAAGGPLVLAGIHLHVEPGTTVGIWGASGAGKSTLLALLPRLYDLPEGGGRILLDGRDIRSLNTADLRRSVMLVPQQARLFEGTIRFNLTYAARDADEALIRRALEAVDLADLVHSLPQGLDTWVGERGASLSGGQRQRLALARALIAQPPVLLLDDCTSALDAQTECYVRERIASFRPQQTRLIVSHKPEAMWAADWVVMLDRGRVVRQGPPQKVLGHLINSPEAQLGVFPGSQAPLGNSRGEAPLRGQKAELPA
jgi:ABC-type multidrug transport system fused ATPase/permease subunit